MTWPVLCLFIELLQITLGHKLEFSRVPSTDEWRKLFMLSRKQALLGVTYTAIERIPKEQRPSRQLLIQWFVAAEDIKTTNAELNQKVLNVSRKFYDDGFRNIILKGQSVARYYKSNNLDLYRAPGDIDIWLEGSREEIISYVRIYKPNCKIVYHHIDFPKMYGIDVEVHFTPSWMNSYFTNKTLQNLFEEHKDNLFTKCSDNNIEIPSPTINFDRIYILVHIYRHLFHEGVGLRQLMDYYFVLIQGFTEKEREHTMKILHSLKMSRFASAVMWIMQEVFGMDRKYLITTPNKSDGYFLLEEIMRAGNLGQHNPQILRKKAESDLSHGIRKVKRNLRFIMSYPSEVIWSPMFKIWHYFWRKHLN